MTSLGRCMIGTGLLLTSTAMPRLLSWREHSVRASVRLCGRPPMLRLNCSRWSSTSTTCHQPNALFDKMVMWHHSSATASTMCLPRDRHDSKCQASRDVWSPCTHTWKAQKGLQQVRHALCVPLMPKGAIFNTDLH